MMADTNGGWDMHVPWITASLHAPPSQMDLSTPRFQARLVLIRYFDVGLSLFKLALISGRHKVNGSLKSRRIVRLTWPEWHSQFACDVAPY
jgi:hypothetical protein